MICRCRQGRGGSLSDRPMKREEVMTSRDSSRPLSGLLVVCMGILLSLRATPAWSQATSSSTVTGTVTDQQNAAIPGVEVRLVDVSTNSSRTTTTNDTGRYIFVNVPSGTFNVIFVKAGFAQSRVTGQQAAVGSTLTVNTTLEVGATTTTVEVTASKGADL